MDINDIPKAWRSALASVQVTFPDAVIAGGALRDREHGVKVKDIDIFISTSLLRSSYGAGNFVSRLQRDGWADVQLNGDESYGNDALAAKRGLVSVVDLKFPGTPGLQLIAMKQFKLEEIDFGICQIMFDGKTIVRTRDYQLDAAARQFRLVPKVDDAMFVRSLGRWSRLKEKYPEWKLHLGSRAETDPFVPPKRELVFNHIDMRDVRPRGGSIKAYLDTSPRSIQDILSGPGDYVVPKAVAERLARETTAQLLKTDGVTQTCTVHVDNAAVIPSAKIIQEMIEAKRQMEQHMQAKREARIDNALFHART